MLKENHLEVRVVFICPSPGLTLFSVLNLRVKVLQRRFEPHLADLLALQESLYGQLDIDGRAQRPGGVHLGSILSINRAPTGLFKP